MFKNFYTIFVCVCVCFSVFLVVVVILQTECCQMHITFLYDANHNHMSKSGNALWFVCKGEGLS